MKRLALPIILIAFAAGRLVGQSTPSPLPDRLTDAEARLQLKCAKAAFDPKSKAAKDPDVEMNEIMAALSDSTHDPAALRQVTGRYLMEFYAGDAAAGSAPQASQVSGEQTVKLLALSIIQQQRTNELLQQLVPRH